ncbi:hypothetical protein C8R43DRAFT_1170187 [Mycena crocata]|nr:hypothetical protein C8R43DRAFT_1170187 [Mycena crocata]
MFGYSKYTTTSTSVTMKPAFSALIGPRTPRNGTEVQPVVVFDTSFNCYHAIKGWTGLRAPRIYPDWPLTRYDTSSHVSLAVQGVTFGSSPTGVNPSFTLTSTTAGGEVCRRVPLMSVDTPFRPLLAMELERHILEMAAHFRPLSIPAKMLVASRVKIWFSVPVPLILPSSSHISGSSHYYIGPLSCPLDRGVFPDIQLVIGKRSWPLSNLNRPTPFEIGSAIYSYHTRLSPLKTRNASGKPQGRNRTVTRTEVRYDDEDKD